MVRASASARALGLQIEEGSPSFNSLDRGPSSKEAETHKTGRNLIIYLFTNIEIKERHIKILTWRSIRIGRCRDKMERPGGRNRMERDVIIYLRVSEGETETNAKYREEREERGKRARERERWKKK